MAIPKIEVTPVNIGAAADDGTGDKLRKALELLNSNDASVARVLAAILKDADPEMSSFAQIAQVIYDFNAVVQSLPLPAAIQAQVTTAINAALAQLPTPQSYTAQIQTAIAAAVAALDANNLVKKSGDQLTGALDFAANVSIASAATTDLSNTASNNVEVTGTATVTSFGLCPAGAIRFVRFRDAGLTLTHDAANLILPGAANITTLAGDTAILRSHGSGGWRVFAYQRADGTALLLPPSVAASLAAIASKASFDDVRTLAIQLAKVKGSTVGMAAGVADDFKDQTGYDTVASINAFIDSANNLVGNTGGPEATQSLPAMASNTTPAGYIASASATNGGSASSQPWYAFDQGSGGEGWLVDLGATPLPQWIQRQIPAATTMAAYAIKSRQGNSSRSPTAFSLLGSNDGSAWTTLDSRSGLTWTDGETKTFSISTANQGAYLYYRLNITAIVSGGYLNFDELLLYKLLTGPLDLRSQPFAAAAVPSKGSIFVLAKAKTGVITPNSNLFADISRDGGATWTTGTLNSAGSYGGYTMYEANAFDISGQPSGASMKWRVRTTGSALVVLLDAIVASWGSG